MLGVVTFSAALYLISGMFPNTGFPGGPSNPGILAFFRVNSLITKYDNGNKRSITTMNWIGCSFAWFWTNEIKSESMVKIFTSKNRYEIVDCCW